MAIQSARDCDNAQTETLAAQTDCCIVGGGPAGMVLGLLLARQGVDVTLLEAHRNFDRDFRGDTIHPATLELMDQIGLIERLLSIPHGVRRGPLPIHTRLGVTSLWGSDHMPGRHPYTLMLPQAKFLDMLVAQAQCYPSFHLRLGARVVGLLEEDGAVKGVRYRSGESEREIRAVLTIGADGRFSRMRQLAGSAASPTGRPLDVVWLRVPHAREDDPRAGGVYAGEGRYAAVMDRGDQWQIGYVFAKGTYQRLREEGIEALRHSLAGLVPWLADGRLEAVDWNRMSLLATEASYVSRWYRAGLLLIGDAAHVMSPVAGLGIAVAVQDAIIAANTVGPRLLDRRDIPVAVLRSVQHRRGWQVRLIQHVQALIQKQVMIMGGAPEARPLTQPSCAARLSVTSWLD
jgi:2-polyprenyl-6-methoxyphenol hydroxylase-like FAD-dependent oxidoreductase